MIKVHDVKYVVYGVSDLARTKAFMEDFGLTAVDAPNSELYLRGASAHPYLYTARQSDEPALQAIGMQLASEEDLQRAAKIEGASRIRALDRPGGGSCVDVTMPGGLRLELVHGVKDVPELPVAPPLPMNHGYAKSRFNKPQRPKRARCEVLRLGHVALGLPDPVAARDWAMKNLGMIVSDEMLVPGETDKYIGFFMRCDLGSTPSDHHTFLIAQGERAGAHHISFELQDIDSVYMGHEWLKTHGHEAHWGVGRHVLGSQVFDYWWDPDGFRIEHYADGDLYDNTVPATTVEGTNEQLWTWGPDVPATFFQQTRRG